MFPVWCAANRSNSKGKTLSKNVNFYNLDVVISVGYRVKSQQGIRFRQWATQRLKEYIVKGFALNDERFKSGSSMNYFTELQERIHCSGTLSEPRWPSATAASNCN